MPLTHAVPERYGAWEFEYKLGYDDGLTRAKWAFRRGVGSFMRDERRAAYDAGWKAGRTEKARRERLTLSEREHGNPAGGRANADEGTT